MRQHCCRIEKVNIEFLGILLFIKKVLNIYKFYVKVKTINRVI